jgi:ribosome biogenesis GTPase
MTLDELGWNDFFAQAFAPHAAKGLLPGRVAIPHRGLCWIYTAAGEVEAATAGRIRRSAAGAGGLPAAGDWVALAPSSGEGRGRIEAVLPRATAFIRKVPGKANEEQVVAANADTVFVVTAAGRDLNLRRLERYLALAWESGAQPAVVVTKCDLDSDPARTDAALAEAAVGVPVHRASGKTREGLEAVRSYLAGGRTVALLGPSGVGKSTLINALLGVDRQKVAAVGAFGKGRHTTTQRELILVPAGGLLLDTPGMREIQIWDAGAGIEETFADVEALAEGCRFGDCGHENEPDCAVRDAVGRGGLAPERLASYRKLSAEQRFRETKLDRAAQAETRRAQRAIHKALRTHLDTKYDRKR